MLRGEAAPPLQRLGCAASSAPSVTCKLAYNGNSPNTSSSRLAWCQVEEVVLRLARWLMQGADIVEFDVSIFTVFGVVVDSELVYSEANG